MKNPYLRIFAPRVVIYLVMALAMAYVMHQYGKYGNGQSGRNAPVKVQQKEQSPALTAALKGNPKPIIVVLSGENDDLSELANVVQKKVGESCHITHLASDSDASMRKIFTVKQFPAAILYDTSNHEIARSEGNVDEAVLLELSRKAQ